VAGAGECGGPTVRLGAPAAGNATITLGSATVAILSYTGATVSTNRAFTIGGVGGGTIQATAAAATLTLTGGVATAGNLVKLAANTGNITVSTTAISGAGRLQKTRDRDSHPERGQHLWGFDHDQYRDRDGRGRQRATDHHGPVGDRETRAGRFCPDGCEAHEQVAR